LLLRAANPEANSHAAVMVIIRPDGAGLLTRDRHRFAPGLTDRFI